MSKIKRYLLVSLGLILLSLLMFYVHYLIFGQLENTIYYSLMSICIIPINILAVTIVFEKLMEREKRIERLGKLNMLVGLFFSDIGYSLLAILSQADNDITKLTLDYNNLKSAKESLKSHKHSIIWEKIDYIKLQETVLDSKDTLTSLLSNENILEHETFTNLLLALMHLRDELILRRFKELSHADCLHIKEDVTRVYLALTIQWIDYLQYLKTTYPYMYNTALKLSPFASKQL